MSTHQTNHLHAALLKLILQFRKGTKLGGADGGEIGGVGEEYGPAIANELMKINFTLGGQGLEVRCW